MGTTTVNQILGNTDQQPEEKQVEAVNISTDLPHPPATTSTQQQSQSDSAGNQSVATSQPERISYSQMFQQMSPYKPPTTEELVKERKKQKREAIFSAIGDGISALSNLYFTSKGAKSSFDASQSLSEKARQRFEKLRKEREDNQKSYMDIYLRARQMDDSYDNNERNWRRQLERDYILDKRAEAKEKRDIAMDELKAQLTTNQITKAEYDAETAKVKAEYAEEHELANLARTKAQTSASRASASASNARAEKDRNGGGSSGSKKPSLNVGGEIHTYDTTQDYDRAVEGYAAEYGVDINETITTGTGRRATTTYRRKPIAQIAAEVEAASRQTASTPSIGW